MLKICQKPSGGWVCNDGCWRNIRKIGGERKHSHGSRKVWMVWNWKKVCVWVPKPHPGLRAVLSHWLSTPLQLSTWPGYWKQRKFPKKRKRRDFMIYCIVWYFLLVKTWQNYHKMYSFFTQYCTISIDSAAMHHRACSFGQIWSPAPHHNPYGWWLLVDPKNGQKRLLKRYYGCGSYATFFSIYSFKEGSDWLMRNISWGSKC